MTALVLLGLLLMPVTCTLVAHPHSLFDAPEATGRAGSASLLGHPDHSPSSAAMMPGGRPPLAGAIPLPRLHPGTVLAGLTVASPASVSPDGAGDAPAALPGVSAVALTMVASGLNALHVTLLLLLAVALIAVRPLPVAVALHGRVLAIISPPPQGRAHG